MTSLTFPASFSPSSSSSHSHGDIQSTKFLPNPNASEQRQEPQLEIEPQNLPSSFSLEWQPCVASWCPHDTSEQDEHKSCQCRCEVLSDLSYRIKWVHDTSSALIMIRCPLWVQADPGADNIRGQHIYLGVRLESITGFYLGIIGDNELSSEIAAGIGRGFNDLQFSTSTPPVLIAPASQIVPADEKYIDSLKSFYRLSTRTRFDIYFKQRSITKRNRSLLGCLCQVVTDGSLRNSTSNILDNVISSLYDGQGGIVVDPTCVQSHLEGRQASTQPKAQEALLRSSTKSEQTPALQHIVGTVGLPPPSYSALGNKESQPTDCGADSALVDGDGTPSRLAKRVYIDNDGSPSRPTKHVCIDNAKEPLHFTDPTSAASPLDVKLHLMQKQLHAQQEAMHKASMFQLAAMEKHVISFFKVKLAVMEKRLTSRFEVNLKEMDASIRSETSQRLQEADERLANALEAHRESLNKDISDRQEEISVDVDEQLTFSKGELEDFWKEERKDIDADVEEKLQDAQEKLKVYVESEMQDAVVSLKAKLLDSVSITLSFED